MADAAPAPEAATAPAPEAAPAPTGARTPLQPPDVPDPETPAGRRAKAIEVVRRRRRGKEPETETVSTEAPGAVAVPEGEQPAEGDETEPEKAETAADTEPDEKGDEERPGSKEWRRLKREKQLVAQEKRELRQMQQEYAAWKAEKDADEKLRAEDPYSWARKHGLSMRDLAKKAIGEEAKDPRDAKIEELQAQLQEVIGFKQNFEQQTQQQQIENARSSVRSHVSQEFAATTPDDFPYLHAHEPGHVAESVTTQMIEHFKRTGEELSARDVMASMERELRDYDRRLEAARNRNRPQAAPAAPPAAAPAPVRQAAGDVPSRALASRATDDAPLTQEQRRQRSVQAVRERIGRFA